MDLTVNGKVVAALEAPAVSLSPTLGAFELVLNYLGTLHGITDSYSRHLAFLGARLSLRGKDGAVREVGKLTPDSRVFYCQVENAQKIFFALKCPLQPYQIEQLEIARDGGDLNLIIKLLVRGSTSKGQDEWDEHLGDENLVVPKSAWIAQYNAAKAGNLLLLEVRMPTGSLRHPSEYHLLEAKRKLAEGNWRDCVSECRQFTEELGGDRSNAALDKLHTSRKLMTKDERADAIVGVIQTYGHSAAHSESRNGELAYSRADAKLMLSLAASLAEFYFNQK